MRLDIRADIKDAQRFLRVTQKGVARAASRAINDSLVTVRAEGARAIKAQHPAMRIGDIKANMAIDRVHPSNLEGQVRTKGRPLSLLLFQARQTKRGVTARIGAGKRQLVNYHGRKGFKVKKYGDEVFVRAYPKGRQIRRFRGPSMPGVFRAQGKRFKEIAQRRWAVTFPNRMKYEIEKAKRQAFAI